MPLQDGLMTEVLCNGGFAHAIAANQDNVAGGAEKVQLQPCMNGGLINFSGPLPVEFRQGLEASESGIVEPALQRA